MDTLLCLLSTSSGFYPKEGWSVGRKGVGNSSKMAPNLDQPKWKSW